ncbi:MAG: 3'-5' exonuclease [Spirochaetaceae bacterium]|jgi:DNA polymerase III alpha subunit (gram-positive type)|nr:3'-5' exonuclease [Spirochaetaceae bacterium]
MYTRRFWVDTETTGLSAVKHFAFQISYLIEENNTILHSRTLELRPDDYEKYEFSKQAEAVHGYTRDKITTFQPEQEAIATLLQDLEQYGEDRLTITGYNTNFDITFIKALLNRGNAARAYYKYFDRMHCDIMQLVQACRIAGLINLPHINLENVCRHFDIDTETAHHSMTDILNTKAVFNKITNILNTPQQCA